MRLVQHQRDPGKPPDRVHRRPERLIWLADLLERQAPGLIGRWLPGAATRHQARIRTALLQTGDPDFASALAAWKAGVIPWFEQLQVAALIASRFGDHTLYEACLAMHDPGIRFAPAGRRTFVGCGGALDAVPVYRRLGCGADARFEKIYSSDGKGLRNMQFALIEVLARSPVVRTPALLHTRIGQRLSVVEMGYHPPRRRGRIEDGIAIAKQLARIDVATLPSAHAFHDPYWVGAGLERVRHRLGPDAGAWSAALFATTLERVEAHPRVFSHGDLHQDNYDGDGLVWDWDNAGLRAYGYDLAYCNRGRGYADTRELLEFSAMAVERPDTAARDRLAFCFFTLAFMHQSVPQWALHGFAEALVQLLPRLLDQAS